MSKRRNQDGQYAKKHSPKFIAFMWISTLLSAGLLALLGRAVLSNIASFRPCSINSSGLQVANCGKQSPNIGDLVIFGLFALAAVLFVSLCTGAWRMSRRTKA